MPALQRRRRAPEHARRARPLRAHDRKVPGVVAHAVVLLVGVVVLLVDDDEPERAKGGEDRRPRPDDHVHLPASRQPPLPQSLGPGEPAVQHGHPPREARLHAPAELRRQPDLQHQEQGLLAGRRRPLRQRQVHLGLPRARHAVQQVGPRAHHSLDRRRLVPVQRPRPPRQRDRPPSDRPRLRARLAPREAPLHQGPDRGSGKLGGLGREPRQHGSRHAGARREGVGGGLAGGDDPALLVLRTLDQLVHGLDQRLGEEPLQRRRGVVHLLVQPPRQAGLGHPSPRDQLPRTIPRAPGGQSVATRSTPAGVAA